MFILLKFSQFNTNIKRCLIVDRQQWTSWQSIEDHQNQSYRNPDCSDFDSLDVDGINIYGQLYWATNVQIVNSCIMFDKYAKYYEKNPKQFSNFLMLNINHTFFESYVTLDEIWTSAEIKKVIIWIFKIFQQFLLDVQVLHPWSW